jgi:hypothetical protein
MSTLAGAATSYVTRGWLVFPIVPRGKTPLTQHGLKDATTDPRLISDWWGQWPSANIGYPTGERIVLDVDGPEGEATLKELEETHGKLPPTLEAKTGKGRHIYFAANGTPVKNSAGKLGPHLDIRGEGGYVILPPSIHENGNKYEWITRIKPAPLPAWLAALLAEPTRLPRDSTNIDPKICEGQRNSHLASLAGSMRRREMSQPAIEKALLEENKLRCDPPLPESEVRKVAASVARYEPAAKPGARVPVTVPGVLASDVKPEAVRWLWAKYIPRGKVTIFDGDPGVGKSTVTLEVAARLSRGCEMPDGSGPEIAASGAVIVSLEDGIADTIIPRLIAAGADRSKVRVIDVIKGSDGIDRTPTIPVDLPAIEAAIKDVNAALLVVDPLVATLSMDTNSYKDQDVRRALAPLKVVAERSGIAVVAIRHLNKSGGTNPKYRGGGSIGLTGLARANFLFGEDPDEEGAFVMAWSKGNLAAKPPALKYRLNETHDGLTVAWAGESPHTARSLLAEPETQEESNALADARNFLLEALADGPADSEKLKRDARKAGHSEKTLFRAKNLLSVKAQKVGFGDGQHWEWRLPTVANEATKMANSENLAIFEQASETKPFISTDSPKMAKPENMTIFDAGDGHLQSQPDDSEVL